MPIDAPALLHEALHWHPAHPVADFLHRLTQDDTYIGRRLLVVTILFMHAHAILRDAHTCGSEATASRRPARFLTRTPPPGPGAALGFEPGAPPPEDADDRVAREMPAARGTPTRGARAPEERDAELARTLDLELNLTPDSAPGLPPRRAEAVGGGGLR
ncbi:hypothetical protein BC834DRAFT_968632 [Gloeopeniophorella convolvens]|nr:hypothetical protein BC834DRAFT_968632 [Gloeopeniophorella convolvens]